MNDSTLLLRQISPGHIEGGRVTSQAFKPMPKDKRRLSCYDGDRMSAKQAFNHFIERNCKSVGVMAVSAGECKELALPVDADGFQFPEHVSVVFPEELSESQVAKKARSLKKLAIARDWMYQVQPE
ncbi:MAG: hypothetical protein IKE69_01450 [Thermoguttaceae bacterium]|nr:hypothetical protein [Thermoguttaceae bacterium]